MPGIKSANAHALKNYMKAYHQNRGTIASAVIQAIGGGMNEETLMKATHPMIRKGEFGIFIKLHKPY
jgi:hypothetical protein